MIIKNTTKRRVYLLLISLFCFCWIIASPAFAQDTGVALTPAIFDEVGGARQMIDREIVIKNNSSAKKELYVVISDLDTSDKAKSGMLSSWLEISRGVISLNPGEEKTLPLKVAINANALPGQYHAQLNFVPGANRWDAEAKKEVNQNRVIVNLRVDERVVERVNNVFFKTDKLINIEGKINFLFHLKNIGNGPQAPVGSILIYNRNGEEVSSVPINGSAASLAAGKDADFLATWKSENKIGKYKAKMELVYGRESDKQISDICYFWLLPKWFIYLVLVVVGLLLVTLLYLFIKIRKQSVHFDDDAYNHVIDLKSRMKK